MPRVSQCKHYANLMMDDLISETKTISQKEKNKIVRQFANINLKIIRHRINKYTTITIIEPKGDLWIMMLK